MTVEKRTDLWKETKRLATMISGKEENSSKLIKLRESLPKQDTYDREDSTLFSIIEACKELIYDRKDNKPVFHAICYLINSDKITIEQSNALDILLDDNDTDNDILNILALAAINNVPVYPNSSDLESEYIRYHEMLLKEGWRVSDGEGNDIQVKLTRLNESSLNDITNLRDLSITCTYTPAEIALITKTALNEIDKLDTANKSLIKLETAINELEVELNAISRNESSLQNILTSNPILFGAEYVRVKSKHKLGEFYEMDYALETVSGTYHLVEIEASTHLLFNKAGDPRSILVHAEQQVMDWLEWIESNHAYADKSLPGIVSPVGYVIIGRSDTLSQKDELKLKRRNLIYRGQINILTFDSLLERARNLRRALINS